jgi:hypothetical protein
MRFLPLRHIREDRLQPGLPRPAPAATGFLAPSATWLPASPSGLVSYRSAHGVFPSGPFPRNGAVPVSRSLLSCRYGNPFLSSLLRSRREPGESIDYRALLPVRIRTCRETRRLHHKPMPSWGCASLGCSPLQTGRTEVPNSRTLQQPTSSRRGPRSRR